MVEKAWLLALLGVSCTSVPPVDEGVAALLAKTVRFDEPERRLTGAWSTAAGESVLVVHIGNTVGILPTGEIARESLHFGEGHLDGLDLELVAYLHGVKSTESAAALDVRGVRRASVDQRGEALTWSDGERWTRQTGVPGNGERTGNWQGDAGLVAVAEESGYLVFLPCNESTREGFSVGYGKVGDDGKLRSLFVSGARVRDRDVAVTGVMEGTLDWTRGGQWTYEGPLLGAPPEPPSPLSPPAGGTLPNAVDGTLEWAFDWSDVTGAAEYAIEVSMERARKPYIDQSSIEDSRYLYATTGGFITRKTGWSWRVRARIGTQWTEWSERSRFTVTD